MFYRSTSSARYKKDIEPLEDSIAESIYAMRPVWYRSVAGGDQADWSWLGLIAEEVAAVEPRLATWDYLPQDWNEPQDKITIEQVGEDVEGNAIYVEKRSPGERTLKEGAQKVPDGVQYDRFVVPLIACVQKQKVMIDALEARLSKLEQA